MTDTLTNPTTTTPTTAQTTTETITGPTTEPVPSDANPESPSTNTVPEGCLLTEEQLEAFGAEMDAIRKRLIDSLGEEDAEYIRGIVKTQRSFEVAGRALMYLGFLPPAWIAGVAALSVSKILDNMEIGHNVMHGQYDWMGDPGLNSRMYEWDTMCPSEQWKYSHNYIHHTYTNILGKDRDIGYGILRMDDEQEWRPYYLGNPLYAFLLMMFFEWGVLLHDLEVENIFAGKRTWADTKHLHRGMIRKVRNIWTFGIIFCGHFPAGVATFSEEETENESRGFWYYRQLLGSANITGSKLFHLMTGNLSHQIEHHLFPDIPARRYPQIAPQIREICDRYGLEYNTGPLHKQLGSVARKILRLALPPRRKSDGEPADSRSDASPVGDAEVAA